MTIIINGTTGVSGVDGSAGTPSLQGGDANTGFFYGSDILGFSTGGSERMRLDASGNVGIGTSSPDAKISAVSVDNTASTKIASFYANNLSQGIYIGYDNIATTATTQPMRFVVGNTAEAMRIDSSGNVGIGTSSPSDRLVLANAVAGSGTVGIGIRDTTNNLGGALYRTGASYSYAGVGALETWLYSQGSNNLSLGPDGAGAVKIVTNGSERMRIDSSGRVTMPYQPSFTVVGGLNVSTGNVCFSGAGTVLFNTGSYFNASNGRFTAPVSGKYLVTASGLVSTGNGYISGCWVRVNGSFKHQLRTSDGTNGNYVAAAIACVVDVSATDYIDLYYNSGSGNFGGSGGETWFSACLLG